ncbi:MAG TPA: hypothetical protein VFY68_18315, partial [Nitrososphaeraceae archaeon]|nr:hypothetical protein [Nitrososphaeraceae archaeon]
MIVSGRTNSLLRLFSCLVIALLLVVIANISINGGANSPRITSAQPQQPQANLTSVEQQQLMEGISFEIENVTFSHHVATVNGI